MKKVGIIGAALAPEFNEATANQIYILSGKLNAKVITCNDIGLLPFKKIDQYFIINAKYIMNRVPLLSFINGAIIYMIIKYYEHKFNTIILPGGVDSEFLKYLNPKKCVPIITSIPFIDNNVKIEMKKIAPRLQKIIAQSKKTNKQLVDMGIDPNKIILMYPIVNSTKFNYSKPPSIDKFCILFASSPNLEVDNEDNFRDKGVLLLLTAFKRYIKYDISAELYIIWRGCYTERLYKEIEALNLNKNVIVINCSVGNMPQMYAQTHVTVVPFLNLWRSPEIPSSALESLFSGRPLISTDVGEISDIVKKYDCGVSTPANEIDLCCAIKNVKAHYLYYQKNTLNFYREYVKMTKSSWGNLFDEQ
jgi:glycosyltransferase involved in cell wall biosynthesis